MAQQSAAVASLGFRGDGGKVNRSGDIGDDGQAGAGYVGGYVWREQSCMLDSEGVSCLFIKGIWSCCVLDGIYSAVES